jgi:hypothetical protein
VTVLLLLIVALVTGTIFVKPVAEALAGHICLERGWERATMTIRGLYCTRMMNGQTETILTTDLLTR